METKITMRDVAAKKRVPLAHFLNGKLIIIYKSITFKTQFINIKALIYS